MRPIQPEVPVDAAFTTRVGFRVAKPFRHLDLPVEVRRADAALVARKRSSDFVELGPGRYTVRAWLPGGEELFGKIVIPSQKAAPLEVDLTPDEAGPAPSPPARSGLPKDGDCALFRGDLLAGPPLGDKAQIGLQDGRLSFGAESDPLGPCTFWYGESAPRKRDAFWPVPDAARQYATFQVVEDRIPLEPRLRHPQAELVLGYLRRGAHAEAEVSAGSPLIPARVMVKDKRGDPLAAAMGAYLLLRHRALTAADLDWAGRFCEYNPNLPDAYCIYAELLSAHGAHAKAFDALAFGLSNKGLPFFTDGLTLAASHLARYLRAAPEQVPWLDEPTREWGRWLLARLDWLGAHRVIGRPVLTLEGLDPSEESEEFPPPPR
jgi:hypothetical protein